MFVSSHQHVRQIALTQETGIESKTAIQGGARSLLGKLEIEIEGLVWLLGPFVCLRQLHAVLRHKCRGGSASGLCDLEKLFEVRNQFVLTSRFDSRLDGLRNEGFKFLGIVRCPHSFAQKDEGYIGLARFPRQHHAQLPQVVRK